MQLEKTEILTKSKKQEFIDSRNPEMLKQEQSLSVRGQFSRLGLCVKIDGFYKLKFLYTLYDE